MNASAAIADPLFLGACGQWACPSDPQRLARVRFRSFGLCAHRSHCAARRFGDERSRIMRAKEVSLSGRVGWRVFQVFILFNQTSQVGSLQLQKVGGFGLIAFRLFDRA